MGMQEIGRSVQYFLLLFAVRKLSLLSLKSMVGKYKPHYTTPYLSYGY